MSCPDVPAQLAERGVEVRGGSGCQRLRALGRHADVLLQEEPATRAARFSTRCQTAPLTTKQTGSTGMELLLPRSSQVIFQSGAPFGFFGLLV